METAGRAGCLNFRVVSRKSCRVCGMQATKTPTQSSMHDQITPSSTSSSDGEMLSWPGGKKGGMGGMSALTGDVL